VGNTDFGQIQGASDRSAFWRSGRPVGSKGGRGGGRTGHFGKKRRGRLQGKSRAPNSGVCKIEVRRNDGASSARRNSTSHHEKGGGAGDKEGDSFQFPLGSATLSSHLKSIAKKQARETGQEIRDRHKRPEGGVPSPCRSYQIRLRDPPW